MDAERDYIECQILDTIFSDASLGDKLIFAGGATLTKSYNLCHRISRDLDLSCTEFTDIPIDRTRRQLQRFKDRFKEFVFDQLRTEINYVINQDKRFMIATDREWRVLHNPEQRVSYPALHVLYKSMLNQAFNYICIEIIPRKYSVSAISHQSATPYLIPGSTRAIPTVAYAQTFWDKIFALHSVANDTIPRDSTFFSRHYFDVAQMSDKINIDDTYHMFNDTVTYQMKYTTKNIVPVTNAADICILPRAPESTLLESDYVTHNGEFLATPPTWDGIIQKLLALKSRLNAYSQGR